LIALGAGWHSECWRSREWESSLLPTHGRTDCYLTDIYPGAGPNAVDSLVTRKIEDPVAGLSEVDHVQSTSTEGVSSVSVTFTEKAPRTVPSRWSAASAPLAQTCRRCQSAQRGEDGSGPSSYLGCNYLARAISASSSALPTTP